MQPSKIEYRLREIVKITVCVDLQKELGNIANVVFFTFFVTTFGTQMQMNVSLGAPKWESEILCFLLLAKARKSDQKDLPNRVA
jgi:Kef-type K+ transport system membrane component KefB